MCFVRCVCSIIISIVESFQCHGSLISGTRQPSSSRLPTTTQLGYSNEEASSETMSKPRILCLHGKAQTGESFAKKIGGARRKLERAFDLTFLDAPIDLEDEANQSVANNGLPMMNTGRAWFLREPLGGDGDENGEPLYRYTKLHESIDYVVKFSKENGPYDGLMGFSQGGTLATALATSGCVKVDAVVTAGAPCIDEAFAAALDTASAGTSVEGQEVSGVSIPKLHLAGETDAMIPVESVAKLSEKGGNGEIVVHDKGHLFPTKALYTDKMVTFLKSTLGEQKNNS